MSKIHADCDGIVPTLYHYNEHTDELIVERLQPDVEPVLDMCKALQAQGWDGMNADRSMRAVAEIPVTVIEQWKKEGVDIYNADHDAEVMKRLNDPALSGFRLDRGAGAFRNIIVKGPR